MFHFRKEERLTNIKIIDILFNNGNSFFIYPFKIIWLPSDLNNTYPSQIIFSVPKRIYKKAVKRNSIRRKIRESYRLNKNILYNYLENKHIQISLVFIYLAKEELPYKEISAKMCASFTELINQIEKNLIYFDIEK